MGKKIFYKQGYKYQLNETYVIQTPIKPKQSINTDYITLGKNGLLKLRKGYAWDGPSGPTIDTKTFMRGSLVHDALYELIRKGFLKMSYRSEADKLLYSMCKEDGMNYVRRKWDYLGVKYGARYAASKDNQRKVLIAP